MLISEYWCQFNILRCIAKGYEGEKVYIFMMRGWSRAIVPSKDKKMKL
jgi:hypothetical protein